MRYLITGGAGFIGSALVRKLVKEEIQVLVLDKLTYAANLENLQEVWNKTNFQFKKLDICNSEKVYEVIKKFKPRYIMHLAAESHVDNSISDPGTFIRTNVEGTVSLLTASLSYYKNLDSKDKENFIFHHISTDEVYGSLGKDGKFLENTPYDPRSPYSASKASSDHFVKAWHHTYGLPIVLTNCSNNYGPFHFPEKLIPLIITNALRKEKLPVYGKGENIRDWLYVDDHADALKLCANKGKVGETYNIGGGCEVRNIDIVEKICSILDDKKPLSDGSSYKELISFVKDRPGHDFRYAIDCTKIENELGWRAKKSFEDGMQETIAWYLKNEEWWSNIKDGSYLKSNSKLLNQSS